MDRAKNNLEQLLKILGHKLFLKKSWGMVKILSITVLSRLCLPYRVFITIYDKDFK